MHRTKTSLWFRPDKARHLSRRLETAVSKSCQSLIDCMAWSICWHIWTVPPTHIWGSPSGHFQTCSTSLDESSSVGDTPAQQGGVSLAPWSDGGVTVEAGFEGFKLPKSNSIPRSQEVGPTAKSQRDGKSPLRHDVNSKHMPPSNPVA